MFGTWPNISGNLPNLRWGCLTSEASGAFVSTTAGSSDILSFGTSEHSYHIVSFDASKSNGTYSGNLVQPKALQVLPCIRT